ncbi:MAG: hypothetical protein GY696_16260 [Gammaproteobacteria bacterium]|nr:hypothetical protein [Gammaproteobacteria bacterium]
MSDLLQIQRRSVIPIYQRHIQTQTLVTVDMMGLRPVAATLLPHHRVGILAAILGQVVQLIRTEICTVSKITAQVNVFPCPKSGNVS